MTSVPERPFRYRVFISYSHADRVWARRLGKLLETWRVPGRLVGSTTPMGVVPPRLGPVFRDRDELPASSELGATIAAALEDSASMVVVCSPAAARSRWVDEEIRRFKALGRADRVFAFIVDGDPEATDEERQCFPRALRFRVDGAGTITGQPSEPIAADARPEGDGPRRAQTRLLAGLLGVGYDALRQREQHRRNRRLVAITAASLVGMAVTLALAVSARIAQEDAERRRGQAEQLISYLVGDLHQELRTVGRTDLLESLGDEALRYFASLSPRDLNDDLLARQAQALTQIGEVRIDQGRLEAALDALREAYERAAELVARHPGDGDLLYDRAQAEFYVGFVHWTHKDLDRAEAWLTLYRDTTRQLAGLDPTRLDWTRERAYGEYNLGVLSFEREAFDRAREVFLNARATLEGLRDAGFQDPLIDRDIADAYSWQGSIAESMGDLAAAEGFFRESLAAYRASVLDHPEDRNIEEELANVMVHLARVLGASGQAGEARSVAEEAAAIHGKLARLDPGNVNWQRQQYLSRRSSAVLAFASGDYSAAMAIYGELRADEESRAEGGEMPRSLLKQAMLLRVARAQAELARRDSAAALDEARQAVAMAERRFADSPGTEEAAELALALVVRGMAAGATGDEDAARDDYALAFEAIAPAAQGSRAWFVLDPYVRAAVLSGHADEAGAARRMLEASGYVPLWPWPEPGEAGAESRRIS